MCGIAGVIRYRSNIDGALLARQRDTMVHRGPDSSGIWESADSRVGLAHRRLAIIDLTPGGHQPMVDSQTGAVITFNGEIFNYTTLREQLRQRGHTFHSHSDTEVILVAYREWGADCLRELNGQFAFAIYDPTRAQVLLARDRAGEKPLFYHQTDEGLSFASEVKALLADPRIPRRALASSVNEYFAYGYVTGERTMFADIKRLPPAGRMIVDLSTQRVRIDRYWTLPAPAAPSTPAVRCCATRLVGNSWPMCRWASC
jgi:asparagine synthase (glutamine-hydrolysing)